MKYLCPICKQVLVEEEEILRFIDKELEGFKRRKEEAGSS